LVACHTSESPVKHGERIAGIDTELVEELERNDPSPCGSGSSRTGRFTGEQASYYVRDR
jgi:hypothetical protein